MQIIFTLLLYIFHIFYALAIRTRLFWKQHPSTHPKALLASRRRLPKHLAIILAVDPTVSSETAEATLTESVVNAVEWCRAVGIVKLTVYEEHDRLSKCEQKIRECLPAHTNEAESSDSETEYPLTPPPSDYSESRPLSPNYNQESLIPLTTIHFDEQVPRKENKSRQKFVKQPTRNPLFKS
ncbi:hyphal tip protein [Crassisporium funariophilum]|nr:hyphal tip protein [Crassisporium funariophilum]